jgi:proline iminopeptidase
MNSSVKVCNDYVNSVLAPQMNPKALAEIIEIEKNKDFANPKYMGLLLTEFYTKFVYRYPVNEWPGYIYKYMGHSNNKIYNLMQGPSEFGGSC